MIKTILLILGVIILFLVVMFGIPALAYWIVLKAGAPKFVAVIVAIAVFFLMGNQTNKTSFL